MMQHRFGSTQVLLAALLSLGWVAPAHGAEVYTWTDEDGVLHFSDTPPASGEMETLELEDVREPASPDADDPSDAHDDSDDAVDANAPDDAEAPVAGGEPELSAAAQKREQMARQRAERRQAQAEADRMCAQHRQRLEQMEPARRVFYANEQGESVRMDDDVRMGLIDESKAFLADNCD